MSYTQGTAIKLIADFTEADSTLPVDPTEVVLTVRRPDGTETTHTLSGGQVVNDPLYVGRFTFRLDTTPMAGIWEYQFESTGGQATVGRASLTVRSRL